MMRVMFVAAMFFVVGGLTIALAGEQPGQEQQAIAGKLPVPDDAAYARAIATVKQVFDEDYRSRKVETRRALVPKLRKQADDPANDAVTQYVLLTEAARIAAEAGDAQAALDAAAKKALRFQDNPLQLKLDVLSIASKAPLSPDDQTSLASMWGYLVHDALSAEMFDVAEKAAIGACNAAYRAKNKELGQRTLQDKQRIKTAARLFAAMAESKATLTVNPGDPDANAVLGRYLCFVKNRWEDGLPRLAKVDDTELKSVAEGDLATPKEPRDRAQMGHRWYQLAKQEKDALGKTSFQIRARYWYNLALPGLAGIDRAKVETRMVQIGGKTPPVGATSRQNEKNKQTEPRTLKSAPCLFSKQQFDKALKTGHGTWHFADGRIAVYSWSYGLPGLLIFGEERSSGYLQATMKNGGDAASGCQELVMCLTKEVKEDDGYHGSAAYFVRYSGGTVELLDAIPYCKAATPPRRLANAPVKVEGEAFYTLRLSVRDGNMITVWLNEKRVLEYAAKSKLRGKYALLVANGSYLFRSSTEFVGEVWLGKLAKCVI
jgi:hypothetical protein